MDKLNSSRQYIEKWQSKEIGNVPVLDSTESSTSGPGINTLAALSQEEEQNFSAWEMLELKDTFHPHRNSHSHCCVIL